MTGWRKRGGGVKPMNTTKEQKALKLALEALDGLYMPNELERVNKAIIAINEALMSFQDGAQQSAERVNPQGVSNEQVEPVAYLKFWAGQQLHPEGGVDADWGYEVCRKGEIGVDGIEAFPVFAHPPVPYVTPSRTAQPKETKHDIDELCAKHNKIGYKHGYRAGKADEREKQSKASLSQPLVGTLLYLFREWKEDHMSQHNYIEAIEAIMDAHGIKE